MAYYRIIIFYRTALRLSYKENSTNIFVHQEDTPSVRSIDNYAKAHMDRVGRLWRGESPIPSIQVITEDDYNAAPRSSKVDLSQYL